MKYDINHGVISDRSNTKILALALTFALTLVVSVFSFVSAAKPETKPVKCDTIQGGSINYSAGHYLADEPLTMGFDDYGYNYQGHMFSGSYANSYLGGAGFPAYEGDTDSYLEENPDAEDHWAWPYRDVQLLMKWNDAWISNTDCDTNGSLDRHEGFNSYIGSGAWLTNHQSGVNDDGTHWNYFTKIVAAPADATEDDGIWYSADGTEIGPVIWGEFATVMEVYNDGGTGDHGVQYVSPERAGLGNW